MTVRTESAGDHEGTVSTYRGRSRGWLIGLILGIVLGGAGGTVAYLRTTPLWSSTGMIHIKPYIAPLLRPSEETGVLHAYQSFRETQVALLRQQRVIEMALQSPEWHALKRLGTVDEVWQDFLTRLQVVAPGGDETVLVIFTDPDPNACVAAVKGVLRAYSSIYLEKEQLDLENKMQLLSAIRISFSSERDAKREAIRSIAREFGTDDLRPIYQAKQTVLSQLESELSQIKAKIAAINPPVGPDGAKQDAVVVRSPRDMTVLEIALVDPRTRELQEEYQVGEARIAAMLQKLGENHADVKAMRSTQEIWKNAVERSAEQWRQSAAKAEKAPVAVRVDPAGMSHQQLETAGRQLEEAVQALQAQVRDIGLKMLDIERLRLEEREKDASVAEVARRIETLQTEGRAGSRVSIISWGDRPVENDRRPLAAGIGAASGLLLGFILAVIIRIFRRVGNRAVST